MKRNKVIDNMISVVYGILLYDILETGSEISKAIVVIFIFVYFIFSEEEKKW